MEDRENDDSGEPIRHNRRFDALALGAIGIGVSLLVALLVANRDAQNQTNRSIESYATDNNRQHQQIWQHVQDVERWICTHAPRWSKCQ